VIALALALQLLCLASVFADGDLRSLRNHVQPEVGYVHAAVPLETGLSRSEVNRWKQVLQLSDVQSAEMLKLYEAYLDEQYNPFVDRSARAYLEKSASASAVLQSAGMTSDEFRAAWRSVDREARSLLGASRRMEEQLLIGIEAIQPALTAGQLDRIQILRLSSSRRHARAVPSPSRWVRFELRPIWESEVLGRLAEADRAEISSQLDEYEQELTPLLDQWSRSHLEAARRIQDYLVDSGRGQTEDGRPGPDRIWERPANLIKRLRALHLRANDGLLAALDDATRADLAARVEAKMYPELYPDPMHAEASRAFVGALAEPDAPAPLVSAVRELREQFDRQYDALAQRLKSRCDRWDDEVASGVGTARGQGLAGSIADLLDERRSLCREYRELIRAEVALYRRSPGEP
jgi:hypothetical protein